MKLPLIELPMRIIKYNCTCLKEDHEKHVKELHELLLKT